MKPFLWVRILVVTFAGLLIISGVSAADESRNLTNTLIQYKSVSVQSVSGTPDGLWHETTMDEKSGVWYYEDETTQNYVTGDTNSGTLDMAFDLTNLTFAALTLDTKYKTESSPDYDTSKIMVGVDVLWERSSQNSVDASGSFGWESLGPFL
jgi:hypothetical protein